MKILYKRNRKAKPDTVPNPISYEPAYFKSFISEYDIKNITGKQHQHTNFEMHIVSAGFQEYEVNGKKCRVEAGEYLLIFPKVLHAHICSGESTARHSLMFFAEADIDADFIKGKTTQRMADNIDLIVKESSLEKETSELLVENYMFEIVIAALRAGGLKEKSVSHANEENTALSIAKQYIKDNIERDPQVSDVASHCYLSRRQLTRIFEEFEGISPGEYIRKRRTEHIENLILDNTLTLRQISDRMNFRSEYYFCAFFKKNAGTSPGKYRQLMLKR